MAELRSNFELHVMCLGYFFFTELTSIPYKGFLLLIKYSFFYVIYNSL